MYWGPRGDPTGHRGPAVNSLRTLGRWAVAELTEIYQIDIDFKAKGGREFDAMLARAGGVSTKILT